MLFGGKRSETPRLVVNPAVRDWRKRFNGVAMNHRQLSDGLSISQRPVGPRVLLVRLGGDLTSESACALAKWVGQMCAGHARVIHTDVGRLSYIDDSGAWTLALAIQCVRFHGIPVKIYNAPLALRSVLDVVCVEGAQSAGPPRKSISATRPSRSEHESLGDETPPRGWLAIDLLICNEDPQLSSMFAIFDQLSCGQSQPRS